MSDRTKSKQCKRYPTSSQNESVFFQIDGIPVYVYPTIFSLKLSHAISNYVQFSPYPSSSATLVVHSTNNSASVAFSSFSITYFRSNSNSKKKLSISQNSKYSYSRARGLTPPVSLFSLFTHSKLQSKS